MKVNINQMTLWGEVLPQRNNLSNIVYTQNENDENEVTSQTMSLLRINAKEGDSLKARNPNLTGEQLKAKHKADSMALKDHLSQLAVSLQGNSEIGGAGLRVTKSRVSIVYKRFTPQVEMLTPEEIAKRMGQSVEWVKANMVKPAPVLDAATGKELKPAPQNGKPELQPKPKKSKKAKNETPAPVQAPAPQA